MNDVGPGAYVTDGLMPSCQRNWLIWSFSKYYHSIHTGSISLQNGRLVHQQPDELMFCELIGGTGCA